MASKGVTRKSGSGIATEAAPLLAIPRSGLGQSYPKQYPARQGAVDGQGTAPDAVGLGTPMPIREVARMLGCSVWTVRQKYMPRGLPCLRPAANGKLIFFRDQVVRWILQQQHKQQKGGR